MAIPLVARIGLIYDGRRILAGDRFSARNPEDAKILMILGRAARTSATVPRPTTPPEPDQTAVTIGPSVDEESSDFTVPKRRYRRRDLTADMAGE